MGKANLRELL